MTTLDTSTGVIGWKRSCYSADLNQIFTLSYNVAITLENIANRNLVVEKRRRQYVVEKSRFEPNSECDSSSLKPMQTTFKHWNIFSISSVKGI